MNLAFEQPFRQSATSTTCGTVTVTDPSGGGGQTPPDDGGGTTPPDNGGGTTPPGNGGVTTPPETDPSPGGGSDQIIPVIPDTIAFVGGGAVVLLVILLLLVQT